MANLIAPQQATPVNVEASAFKSNPNVKTAGKNGKEIQKAASEAFDASLKEQLANEAKKEELKKGLSQVATKSAAHVQVLPQQLPVGSTAKKVNGDPNSAELTTVEKTDKTVDAKAGAKLGQDRNSALDANAIQAKLATQAKNLSALTTGQGAFPGKVDGKGDLKESAPVIAEGNGNEKTPQKVAVAKDNLTPLQQMMLSESATMKKAQFANPQVAAAGPKASADLQQALQAMASQNPELDHEFDVESLAVAGGAEKALSLKGKEEGAETRTPVSKVSTSDFLDLRNLSQKNALSGVSQNANQASLDLGTALKNKDGKKDKLEALTGKEAFAGTMAAHFENGPHIKTIDAPVTQGTAGKNILSHDAIHQMTQSVNLLSQARQDGEIKIRLRPDHLGELHMSVKTQGQQVSLEIRAQNGESKKILEASIASLKDSLGQQNLTLARVDIVNAPAHAQNAADQGMQMDMSQFRQNSGQGQNSDRGFDQGGRDLRYEELSAPVNLNTVRSSRTNASSGQGLDLIA